MSRLHIKLRLETINEKTGNPICIRTVLADSPEEAVKAMEDIINGNVDISKVSKKGLDVRKSNGSSK